MLILIAIPVVVAGAFVHRFIQEVAPSNVLVRSVRTARPSWRLAVGLLGLAAAVLMAMHVAANAVSAGAPEWLNLVVLLLAWDAIKLGVLACMSVVRCVVPARAGVSWGIAAPISESGGRTCPCRVDRTSTCTPRRV